MIIHKEQFEGWFSTLGTTGVMLTNVLTVVIALIMVALAAFFTYRAIKVGIKLSSSDDAQQRSEAKKSLFWLMVGIIIAIVLPAILITLFQTIGKTIQVKSPVSSAGAEASLSRMVTNFKYTLIERRI